MPFKNTKCVQKRQKLYLIRCDINITIILIYLSTTWDLKSNILKTYGTEIEKRNLLAFFPSLQLLQLHRWKMLKFIQFIQNSKSPNNLYCDFLYDSHFMLLLLNLNANMTMENDPFVAEYFVRRALVPSTHSTTMRYLSAIRMLHCLQTKHNYI